LTRLSRVPILFQLSEPAVSAGSFCFPPGVQRPGSSKVNHKRRDVAAVTQFGSKGGFASRFSLWQAS